LFVFQTLSRPDFRLPAQIAMIAIGLGRALYQHGHADRAIPLICERLLKLARDFQTLFDQWGMGCLPATRKRPHQNTQAKPAATQPKPPRQLGFAWLVNILPEATIYRAQLQNLLAEPNTAAFLAEVPQARKILRPLCHLFGVRPSRHIPRPQHPIPSAHPAETARPENARPENAPLDITPKERPTAPMAPDQMQFVDAKPVATRPEFLPEAA
jgi:hypothetical protein